MTPTAVERLLHADGWVLDHTHASHKYYRHPTKGGMVCVPFHRRDLKAGTLRSIIRQAGWSRDEFERRRLENPVRRMGDQGDYFAILPRRYKPIGGEWWIGPFKTDEKADIATGLVRAGFGADVETYQAKEGFFVHIKGGLRLKGPPVVGPFDKRTEAGSVLGKLKRRGWRPVMARLPEEFPARKPIQKAEPKPPPPAAANTNEDAVGALRNLGWKKTEAEAYVKEAVMSLGPGRGADTEAVLKYVFRAQKERNRPAANPARTEPCPGCGETLRIPARFRRGRCPGCGAMVQEAA